MGKRLWTLFAILMLNGIIVNNFYATSNSTSIEGSFEDLAGKFVKLAERLLTIFRAVVAQIARIAYTLVGMIGVLLYFSRLNKRIGIDLIKGAIILAVIAEIIFPFLV